MSHQYDLAIVRELINAAFGLEDLNNFCFDHFRSVYDEFVETDRKSHRVRQLVAMAERKGQLEQLLNLVRQQNPGKYAKFQAGLTTGPTASVELRQEADEANQPLGDQHEPTSRININAPEAQIGAVGEKVNIEDGIHFGSKLEQSGQTIHGDQYNAGRDIMVNKTASESAGLPNTKFWIWVLAIGAIITIIAGIISSVSDGLSILGY